MAEGFPEINEYRTAIERERGGGWNHSEKLGEVSELCSAVWIPLCANLLVLIRHKVQVFVETGNHRWGH